MRTSSSELRALIAKLDGATADSLESDVIEFKPWDPEPSASKNRIREIRETVVCFANALGGAIIIGVRDRVRTRAEAITGTASLGVDALRKAIYDGTDPHLLVDVEELIEPEGRLVVLHVPKGLGLHTTTEGVLKIRVGKDCQPLTGSMITSRIGASAAVDRSAMPISGATIEDLEPKAIDELGRRLDPAGSQRGRPGRTASELLEGIGLIREGELTLAALLLCGREATMRSRVPEHELVFVRYASPTRYDVRLDLRSPILLLLDQLERLFEAHLGVTTVGTDGLLELTLPDITWWVAREAVLNAIVHRDYFLREPVHVELRKGRVEVTSPGGFIGGVGPENILRHPPVRRNPLLAEALQGAGYVNRSGMGVDRIYEELLRAGKSFPRYEADESSVRLELPTESHLPFAKFIVEERRLGHELDLDDLILLRVITDRGETDRWSAEVAIQRPEDEAARRLISLRERGYLTARGRGRGTSYRLRRELSDALRGRGATDDTLHVDAESVVLRIHAILGERGRITNAEVRRISGYSRAEAIRVMRRLRDAGVVSVQGRGRGAHYVPGSAFPSPLGRERSSSRRSRKRR